MSEKILGKHSFEFNKKGSNDSIVLETTVFDNGDMVTNESHINIDFGIYFNQSITLNSYENSATINLSSDFFTPELLEKLAKQLRTFRTHTISEKIKNQESLC